MLYKGRTYALPCPHRHHELFEGLTNPSDGSEIQGFLDDRGKFLNRTNALAVALKSGQVIDEDSIRAGQLYSEDLW